MSNIEWTGITWNFITGCKEHSPGCRNCYAKFMAWRHMHNEKTKAGYTGTVKKLDNGELVWTNKINLLPDRLLIPVLHKKPTLIFPCSMSDLFHKDVPFEFIDQAFAIMMLCPQHTFQVLTKRTDRMLEYCRSRMDFDQIQEAAELIVSENAHLFHVCTKLSKAEKKVYPADVHISNQLLPHLEKFGWFWEEHYTDDGNKDYSELIFEESFPPKHIWLGTSIEDQPRANRRGPALFELHKLGWTTWVSNEPAIGPVNWEDPFYFGFLDWMVTGGESGSTARPMHPDWARNTRDFCAKNKIPFFFKQWGSWAPADQHADGKSYNAVGALRDGTIGSAFDAKEVLANVGKHAGGRVLDGITNDAIPDIKNSLAHV